ncbi:MAG: hypothetical protein WC809_13130 [Sinimarinibacterium sp.]|jgi:hypothetical protein
MKDYHRDWLSLREIDAAAGARKGTAFRCFKRVEATLDEGRDYVVLHAGRDRDAISELRSRDRIYAGSVNVLLLGPATAERIADVLRISTSTGR